MALFDMLYDVTTQLGLAPLVFGLHEHHRRCIMARAGPDFGAITKAMRTSAAKFTLSLTKTM